MEDTITRVAWGAALLDEKVPDWYTRIDPETLDLKVYSFCVIGQVFGLECSGLVFACDCEAKFNAAAATLGLTDHEAIAACGFDELAKGASDEEYALLTQVWLHEIRYRLMADDKDTSSVVRQILETDVIEMPDLSRELVTA